MPRIVPSAAPVSWLGPWVVVLALVLTGTVFVQEPALAQDSAPRELPPSQPQGRPAAVSTSPAPVLFAGRSLTDALGLLEGRGLEIVFNSRVVPEHLRVAEEPQGQEPREILSQLLEPHGLTFRSGPRDRLIIIPRKLPREVRGVEPLEPQPAPREQIFEEIVVTPSRVSLTRKVTEPLTFPKDLVMTLPGLADDPVRGLKAVPGVTATDASARISVRGGPADGTQLFLDGVELLEPYHLQDFGGASSIVAPEAVESIDVLTGSASAEIGGRTGGIVDMHSLVPRAGERTRIGFSLLDSHLLHSGHFAAGRGYWLGIARIGTFSPAFRVAGRQDQPTFWDLFAKVEAPAGRNRLGADRTWTTRVLHADDHLNFEGLDEDSLEDLESRYQSSYLWSTLTAPLSNRLFSATAVSYSRLERERLAQETGPEVRFVLDDRRRLGQFGVTQDFDLAMSARHALTFGFDGRHLNASFRYGSSIESRDPLAALRTESESGAFVGNLGEQQQLSVYASDVYRPFEDLSVQLGLRFERYTLTDRADLTPRLAMAYWLGGGRVLRLSWGSFVQNQRPYELQLTDGETEFAAGERSSQAVVSYEQPLSPRISVRLEAYRRTTANPRPRFVNLFEPRAAVPEVQSDRVRLAPEYSEAEGVELLLRGTGRKQSWWLHYARAGTGDRITDGHGTREIPAPLDQPHAVTAQYEVRLGSRWRAGAVWRYHTGWPTTSVTATVELDETGQEVVRPELGPLFGDRQPEYHRLDLRLSRTWRLSLGELEASLDVQNLYNRHNVRGYEIGFAGPPGAVEVERDERYWRGFFPSFGISWAF